MKISSKRAEYAAWASLILSGLFFIISWLIGRWSGFFAVSAASWLILSAGLICFALVVQFHQRALAEQEKLDMNQLTKGKDSAAIFQTKSEADTLFAAAQGRLQILEKWFLPIFSALIATYQIGIGVFLLNAKNALAHTSIEPKQPLISAICMTAIAFVSFLMSRYASGMSIQPLWKPLRAAGSFLLGVAVICFVLSISLALVQFKIAVVINIVDWVIPSLLVLLGVETAVNVIFDIYRPRLKGQYSRSAFDSRLLGTISEPGGIFRTAAGAIDYQFGFKVSQTWFYKLLEKAVVPLVLFAAVVLYLMSCFIVVNPNEQAIIERLGNPLNKAGKIHLIEPGLTFKWPWPFEIAYKYPSNEIKEINIGFTPKLNPKTNELVREPLLWGKAHYAEEDKLLVASEQTTVGLPEGAVPVSIIMAAVPVQYRVKDLYAYLYNHHEPEQMLKSICYRELTRFAASAKIEADDDEQSVTAQKSLLGAGRGEAERILFKNIQKAADEEKLGVEIIFVGLQGIHPPPEVSSDYQQVVGAVQKKQALILNAQAERNMSLSTLAGSVEDVDRLYDLALRYQDAKEKNQTEEIEKLGAELDSAFAGAKGEIFAKLRAAQSYAFEKSTTAKATGERFASQLAAYRAGGQIYKREQKMLVLEESLKEIRKYVVVADSNDTQIFTVDLTEKLTPGLYDIAGLEEKK